MQVDIYGSVSGVDFILATHSKYANEQHRITSVDLPMKINNAPE